MTSPFSAIILFSEVPAFRVGGSYVIHDRIKGENTVESDLYTDGKGWIHIRPTGELGAGELAYGNVNEV